MWWVVQWVQTKQIHEFFYYFLWDSNLVPWHVKAPTPTPISTMDCWNLIVKPLILLPLLIFNVHDVSVAPFTLLSLHMVCGLLHIPWRSKVIPIFVAKSQCCTMTCAFYWDILTHEAANVMGVVCTNSASDTMDHTKVVDTTTQEQRRPYIRTYSTCRLSLASKRARIYRKNFSPKIGFPLLSFLESVHT